MADRKHSKEDPKDPKQAHKEPDQERPKHKPEGRDRSKGSPPDYDGDEGNGREPYDDPEEHLEIERRRFRGGVPPTPEMYARAREQWYRLPGSLVRPPMDPVISEPTPSEKQSPGQTEPDEKRGA